MSILDPKSVEARNMEIAHVLMMDIFGYSKLRIDEQARAVDKLKEIVGAANGSGSQQVRAHGLWTGWRTCAVVSWD